MITGEQLQTMICSGDREQIKLAYDIAEVIDNYKALPFVNNIDWEMLDKKIHVGKTELFYKPIPNKIRLTSNGNKLVHSKLFEAFCNAYDDYGSLFSFGLILSKIDTDIGEITDFISQCQKESIFITYDYHNKYDYKLYDCAILPSSVFTFGDIKIVELYCMPPLFKYAFENDCML